MDRKTFIGAACTAAASLLVGTVPAWAQAPFPSRPITLVVPYPPGGVVDPVARVIAPMLARELGQSVVIENKTGAAGAIGAQAVARAEPDGHTVLLHTGVVALHPSTLKQPGYDVRRDLVPVGMVATGPYVIVVNPNVPARTLPELLAYVKANPDKVLYGSAGIGSSTHLVGELLNGAAGLKMRHVPYRGGGPLLAALVAGDIQVGFETISGAKPLAEGGRVRMVAVTSQARNATVPQLPSVAEAGVSGFDATLWEALFLPKGTPDAVVMRWNAAMKKVLASPEVQKRLADFGLEGIPSTPQQLGAQIESDIVKWADVIKSANINME